MKIGFIGGGNMAQALMGGLVAKRDAWGDARFVVVEPHAASRATVARIAPTAALHDVPSADLADCDAVVVAVKPQQFREAAASAARWLGAPLVVSIAAGVRTREINHWLGADLATGREARRIVRAMPNTPALIGEGITGLYATPAVDDAGRALAESIMGAVGQVLWVAGEDKLDAVTAVSGSGPGYVFAFIEALERAARAIGFDDADARRLAVMTFCGASRLASQSEEPIAVLRERVTSKGGTTAAGLDVLREQGCADAVVAAVRAAAERSIALGEEMARESGTGP